ncbi:WD40 repeat-like protein [Mycena chlorophos]|uniref:WD40 repeat-like protein n=1 Tax=Mycena chlorophos TaxID=658473 RepID=A0A8H6SK28_MYCCL|nr:WD40 repeat-like protein [Mycena chlorophos]
MSLDRSPFKDYDSSFLPTDAQISAIRELLVEPRAHLAQLDADIDTMTNALAALREQRRRLRRAVLTHESFLAPIRRLPPEVLQEIFLACLPLDRQASTQTTEAPLLLGCVCRYWRQLSHETADLWTGVLVCGDRETPYYPQMGHIDNAPLRLSTLLPRWLARAGTRPLSLSFVERSTHPWTPDPSSSNTEVQSVSEIMLSTVLQTQHRIGRLEVSSGRAELWRTLQALESSNMPQLTDIRFIFPPDHELRLGSNQLQVPILQHPGLRSVSIEASATSLELPLPWGNLVELRLACFGDNMSDGRPMQSDLHEIFRRCPRLVRCELNFVRSTHLSTSETLQLPFLEELALPGNDLDATAKVLHLVAMPMLRSLRFGSMENREILRPLRAASPSLTVEFSSYYFFAEDPESPLFSILREVPQTTHLRLLMYPFDPYRSVPGPATNFNTATRTGIYDWKWQLGDGFFRSLEAENLCPHLQHIYFSLQSSQLAGTGFIPFLRDCSRRVKHVTIFFQTHEPVDVPEEIQALEAGPDGLRVDLLCAPKPVHHVPWDIERRGAELRRASIDSVYR